MSAWRDRYQRAMESGAGTLNETAWSAAVERAGQVTASNAISFDFEPVTNAPLRREIASLDHGQMVINADLVLAAEDIDSARRDRILRTIEQARAAVARRLTRGQS
jgi:hypothetical protein